MRGVQCNCLRILSQPIKADTRTLNIVIQISATTAMIINRLPLASAEFRLYEGMGNHHVMKATRHPPPVTDFRMANIRTKQFTMYL